MKSFFLIHIILLLSFFSFGQQEIAFLDAKLPERNASVRVMESMETDFDIVNGLIVVSGLLEGRYGYFILDTGAPGLIVNEIVEADPDLEARGIGGEIAVGERIVEEFSWAGMNMENVLGYSIDMDHLEQTINRELLGLVGFDLLQDYEIEIDYVSHKIRLYPSDLGAKYIGQTEPIMAIPFRLDQHLPVVELRIGRKKYSFGIDCGATINLIDSKYQKKLSKEVAKECCLGYLRGLDGQGELSSIITFQQVLCGNIEMSDAEFQWTAFEGLAEQGLAIDGLIGASFFGSERISINYKDGMVYVWK